LGSLQAPEAAAAGEHFFVADAEPSVGGAAALGAFFDTAPEAGALAAGTFSASAGCAPPTGADTPTGAGDAGTFAVAAGAAPEAAEDSGSACEGSPASGSASGGVFRISR
jgi:hypothetical protein